MRHPLVAVAILVSVWSGTLPAQAPRQFDVASIKRNTSGRPGQGPPRSAANGQFTYIGIPVAVLLSRAFSGLTNPITIEGLPDWTHLDRWDVSVRFTPGATLAAQTAMWRTLFTERMKLQAHIDTRARAGYRLVLARPDGTLGPQLKSSTLDCPPIDPAASLAAAPEVRAVLSRLRGDPRAPTPQEESVLMSQCGPVNIGARIYGGAVEMVTLARMLASLGRLDGIVIDETGLTGRFAVSLWATGTNTAPSAAAVRDDAPDIFKALQDQLGLKLERMTVDAKILVVDHIEPPTEN